MVTTVDALLRSRLWAYEGWSARDALTSYVCVPFDQIRPEGVTVQDYERDIVESNATRCTEFSYIRNGGDIPSCDNRGNRRGWSVS